MVRGTPRLIALFAIGIVVAAIYYVQRDKSPAAANPDNVIYVNPNIGTRPVSPSP